MVLCVKGGVRARDLAHENQVALGCPQALMDALEPEFSTAEVLSQSSFGEGQARKSSMSAAASEAAAEALMTPGGCEGERGKEGRGGDGGRLSRKVRRVFHHHPTHAFSLVLSFFFFIFIKSIECHCTRRCTRQRTNDKADGFFLKPSVALCSSALLVCFPPNHILKEWGNVSASNLYLER